MRPIYRVAKATFYEGWRRRFLNGILVFAILIIGSSWVFTYLSPGAELKMLIDVGLGSIRFFGMLIAIFLGTAFFLAIDLGDSPLAGLPQVLIASAVSRAHRVGTERRYDSLPDERTTGSGVQTAPSLTGS